ncbi:hypothetical protein [Gimesia sp.]|uniref:hypothetical protein n=1 Tax=Gimesia sp. TaxID=2024833 RepID=UPI003A943E8E
MKTFIKTALFTILLTNSVNSIMAQQRAESTARQPIVIHSQQLIVVVPESRDQLMAYSMTTNTWRRIPISVKADQKILPTVSTTLAACQLGQSIYAYSSVADKWAVLKLPEESHARYEVGNDRVNAVTKTDSINQFYIFGLNTGAWSGVDLNNGKILEVNPQNQKQLD